VPMLVTINNSTPLTSSFFSNFSIEVDRASYSFFFFLLFSLVYISVIPDPSTARTEPGFVTHSSPGPVRKDLRRRRLSVTNV